VMWVRKDVREGARKVETDRGKIVGKVRIGKVVWKISGIYVNKNLERKLGERSRK